MQLSSLVVIYPLCERPCSSQLVYHVLPSLPEQSKHINTAIPNGSSKVLLHPILIKATDPTVYHLSYPLTETILKTLAANAKHFSFHHG